jgi:hypothetical protein
MHGVNLAESDEDEEPTVTQNLETAAAPPPPADQTRQAQDAYRPGRVQDQAAPSWWRRPWILPLVAAAGYFLYQTLPNFLTLNPDKSGVNLNKHARELHYVLLLGHVGFGTVALSTVCLQVWPWLRRRHPAIHRWSGRLYVFAGVVPAAVLALIINPLNTFPHGDLGATLQGAGPLVTALIGYQAGRRGKWRKHRRWMLYSFAFTTSIIWGLAIELGLQYHIINLDPSYIIEFARWGSWLLNVALVKWWLDHRPVPGDIVRSRA